MAFWQLLGLRERRYMRPASRWRYTVSSHFLRTIQLGSIIFQRRKIGLIKLQTEMNVIF